MIEVKSEQHMQQLGERLGQLLRGGEVIELIGDVGAGKTTFVRGLARGLGVVETIQSPSFTISRLYDVVEGRRLAHYDFYRLADPGIMSDELAETIGMRDTVVVIEWAAAVEQVLPGDRLTITITSPSPTERVLVTAAGGQNSQNLVGQLG
jgi:tRNA threonylcarbamoyladenosine biosynthesis protein TsaE